MGPTTEPREPTPDWRAEYEAWCAMVEVKDGTISDQEATMATLHLWVENQPDNFTCDSTPDYIHAAYRDGHRIDPAVRYDDGARTLAGDDPALVYAEFRRLREAVAAVGHGTPEIDAESDPPSLVAARSDVIEAGYTSAAESVDRHRSREAGAWAEFVAAATR